jgi:hypothetical protein
MTARYSASASERASLLADFPAGEVALLVEEVVD